MNTPAIHQASLLTGRQMVLLIVMGLHALLIGALMTMKIVRDELPPIYTFEALTRITPPPMPEEQTAPQVARESDAVPRLRLPELAPPQVQFPLAERSAPLPDFASGDAVGVDPGPATVPDIAPTELVSRATRSPDEFYPAASLTRQEEGAAIVQVCVAPDGRLEGRPQIQRSSGSRLLDGAAIRWASEALAFTPATRNGAAVSACKGFRVNFSLQ